MTVESKFIFSTFIRLLDRLENLRIYKQGVVEVLIPQNIFYPNSPETSFIFNNETVYVVFISGKFVLVDARGQLLDPVTTNKAFLKFYLPRERGGIVVAVLESLKPSKEKRKEFTLSAPIHNPKLKIAWASPQLAPGVVLYKEK